jgi:hypothetical protein
MYFKSYCTESTQILILKLPHKPLGTTLLLREDTCGARNGGDSSVKDLLGWHGWRQMFLLGDREV